MPTEWIARIAEVQEQRATPAALERLRRASDLDRRTSLVAKRAKRLRASMTLSQSAWHAGVRSADATPSSAPVHRSAMAQLSSPAFLSPMRSHHATMEQQEADEEAALAELAVVAQQHVNEGTLALSDVQAAAQNTISQPAQQAQLEEALRQLEKEPEDEASCTAKFALFEGFAKLTEDARTAVQELSATSQSDLNATDASNVAAQIAREVKSIDRPANLGLADDSGGRWFVHGMCKAAYKNQRLLDGVLTSIQSKLELLAAQTECPICFEAYGQERPATALSCAHKVCRECWGHWCTVAGSNGGVAHCPLCRHEEFFEHVMRAAGRTPTAATTN